MTTKLQERLQALHQQDVLGLIDLIEKNLTDITIDDVVARSGYSRSQCFKLFRDHADITVADYIRRRRLTVSYALLQGRGDNRILECAADVGIYCGPTFFKQFRQQFNLSPKDVVRGLMASQECFQPRLSADDLH